MTTRNLGARAAIAEMTPNDWRLRRAGWPCLYICEDGLRCIIAASSAASPACPLARHTADVKREYLTAKSCAPNCTIGCVHRISYIDHWRGEQTSTISPGSDGAHGLVQIHTGD